MIPALPLTINRPHCQHWTDFLAPAVLNLGHWLTYTQPIVSHAAEATISRIALSSLGNNRAHSITSKSYASYHILGLPAPDQSNEWWFDAKLVPYILNQKRA